MKWFPLLLLSCLLITGCSMFDIGGPSWREILARDKVPELSQLPTVSWEKHEGGITVHVVNSTNLPLSYFGYGPTDPQLFVDKWQVWKWVNYTYDFCGHGLVSQHLPARGHLKFKLVIPSWIGKQARVYTIFTTQDGKRRSLVMLYDSRASQKTVSH